MPRKPIPSVRRAKWHRKSDRWQAQNANGLLVAHRDRPYQDEYATSNGCWGADCIREGWNFGPRRTAPKDHTKTLRRIIDNPKPKKA